MPFDLGGSIIVDVNQTHPIKRLAFLEQIIRYRININLNYSQGFPIKIYLYAVNSIIICNSSKCLGVVEKTSTRDCRVYAAVVSRDSGG